MKGRPTKKVPELLPAILRNDAGEVERLLRAGISPEEKDREGRTAIINAAIDANEEIVKALIAAGADLNAQDRNGYTALHFAGQRYRPEIAGLLLKHGAEVDRRDAYGNTPLWRAVFESKGRGDLIRLLLEHGADRNLANDSGVSPVQLADTIANYDTKQFFG